jgi:outer membrane immunogenic protein
MNFGRAFGPGAFPANVAEKTQTQRLILTNLIKEFLRSSRGRSMKRYLMGTLAIAALIAASPADAGDIMMPTKAPTYKAVPRAVPVVAPRSGWSGLYLGVHMGAGFTKKADGGAALEALSGGKANACAKSGGKPPFCQNQGGFLQEGIAFPFGGGQIGYNYEIFPRWILGGEADFSGAALSRTSQIDITANENGNGNKLAEVTFIQKTHMDWFGTVRQRIGFLLYPGFLFDSALIYGTGGLAYGRVVNSITGGAAGGNGESCTNPGNGSPPFCTTGINVGNSGVKAGFALGGGVEVELSPRWRAKAEYLYIDLANSSLTFNIDEGHGHGNSNKNATGFFHDPNVFHSVRLGLNYVWGDVGIGKGKAPVLVAKY